MYKIEDHVQKPETIFKRLQEYNIRINPGKSEFLTNQINYCGYVIDKNGLHKAPDKIEAINMMQRPRNIAEVHSFIGMINYYGRFIPNLLYKNTGFHWSKDCEASFQAAKKAFTSPKCLAHFDLRLSLTLATDASPYGVGAVLSHMYPVRNTLAALTMLKMLIVGPIQISRFKCLLFGPVVSVLTWKLT